MRKKLLSILTLTFVMILVVGSMAFAWEPQSKGNIKKEDTVLFAAEDIQNLKNDVDACETAVADGKTAIYNKLTEKNFETPVIDEGSDLPTYERLIESIGGGQLIPSDLTTTIPDDAQALPDGKAPGETIDVTAATADNLSLGSAAYVDGELVIGTGGDNENYYQLSSSSFPEELVFSTSTIPDGSNGLNLSLSCPYFSYYRYAHITSKNCRWTELKVNGVKIQEVNDWKYMDIVIENNGSIVVNANSKNNQTYMTITLYN